MEPKGKYFNKFFKYLQHTKNGSQPKDLSALEKMGVGWGGAECLPDPA